METEKNKKLFRVTVSIFVAVFFAFVIVAGVILSNKRSEINQLYSERGTLTTNLEDRDSLFNELAATFDEIEQNLTFIKEKRGQLEIAKQEGVPSRQKVLVADIKLMNTMLEESSVKIADLEQKLKASGIKVSSFNKKIAQLNERVNTQNSDIEKLLADVNQRDMKIAEMGNKVVQLEDNVVQLHDNIAVQSDSITVKDQRYVDTNNRLNKAYFVSGSFKELKEHGVVEKDGGFLGIGRNKVIHSDLNENYFTQLDKRTTDVFPVHAKKARIISDHPNSSYSMVYEDDQIAYIKIEDPKEFWKITDYAIVEVRK